MPYSLYLARLHGDPMITTTQLYILELKIQCVIKYIKNKIEN